MSPFVPWEVGVRRVRRWDVTRCEMWSSEITLNNAQCSNQHIEPNLSVWSGQTQIWRDRPVSSEQSQSYLWPSQASPHRVVLRESRGVQWRAEREGGRREGTVLAENQDVSWAVAVAGPARAGHYCDDQQVWGERERERCGQVGVLVISHLTITQAGTV